MVGILLVLAAIVYMAAAVLVAVFVASFGVLLLIYARTYRNVPSFPPIEESDLPPVTVQVPVYNEVHVATRLIDAWAQLDYPREKLCVQILDDSDDGTTAVLQQRIATWQTQDVTFIDLIHRPKREGYKAGALAYGLVHTDAAYVAILDADFAPSPDFLRRTVPYCIADDQLAMVQTRWEHRNVKANWLTRVQALTLDAHFAVEQWARSWGKLPFSMNGTGAVWRVDALRDAGGWSEATITEDLDLSYRALLRGWKFLFVSDVAVSGEIPSQVQAYKRQQRRWATGMTENLLRHAWPLLRAERYGISARLMGLVHLSSYAVQPLLLLILLLTPLLIAGDMFARLPDLGLLFGVVGVIPTLIMITGQWALRRRWWHTLLYLPLQGLLGAAMVLNNTVGVLQGLHSPAVRREFKRTPKFDSMEHISDYTLPLDTVTVGELLLGAYAAGSALLALDRFPALFPYLLTYTIALWGLASASVLQVHHAARSCSATGQKSQPIVSWLQHTRESGH